MNIKTHSNLNQFFIRSLVILIISFMMLKTYFPIAGKIDLYFIQPWMDQFGHFLYKDNWYLVELNHHIFKNLLISVYLCFLVLWCLSFKLDSLKLNRWQYGYIFWISILSTALIGILKSQSAHACPWNMVHSTPVGFSWIYSATHGHCFPGGHASTGFAFISGFFAYRLTRLKLAYFYLFSGLLLGFMMGWGQMMRGAHFMSHNLWTGWYILLFNILMYALFYSKLKSNKNG